jgi:hypothetical protein
MLRQEFVNEIAKLRPGSTFLVLHKYKNSAGEVADFNIIFNMSYENALKRSIALVEAFVPEGPVQETAKLELLESYRNSLIKVQTTPIEEVDDAYQRFYDDGKLINGIKLHVESNTLHMFGLIHLKRIITPGIYKKVNSRLLTIEKRKIQKLLPVSRFRQFRLKPDQLEKIAVQKITLLPPEEPLDINWDR